MCRASAEAPVVPEAPPALAAQHASRRATRDKALGSAGASVLDAALPQRHALGPSQHRPRAGPQAAPVALVQPVLPRSAKRSLLSRQPPQGDTQQQQQLMRQQQPAASSSGAVVDLQPPSQRLAAIPEAAEESMAQEVPQGVWDDSADVHASARPDGTPLYTAAPADAVLASASAAFQQAAAVQYHTSAEQVESLHGLASPSMMPNSHKQLRSLGGSVSKTERHHRASYLSHPAAAPAAGQEGASEAAAPLSLLQLAAAPTAQQQLPLPSILASTTQHQHAAKHAQASSSARHVITAQCRCGW